jgi:hypothetical protein
MNKSVKFSFLLILTLSLAASVFAQDKTKRNEEIGKIIKLTQTKKPEDQEKAYKMAKDFLVKYGQEDDEQIKKIRDYVDKYRLATFNKRLDELKIAEAQTLGKEILAQEPENTYVFINMAYGGLDLFQKKKDASFGAESINYAKQALNLLEAGKLPTSFEPLKDQAEATAVMYYIIGNFTWEKNPQEGAKNFYKALQYESSIKTSSFPYYVLAHSYERAYEDTAKSYQAKVASKAPDSEILADQQKLEKLVDRMLDAYARALKFAATDNQSVKDSWMQRYTQIYTHKHQSDKGLNEYLTAVWNTPLPDPGQI